MVEILDKIVETGQYNTWNEDIKYVAIKHSGGF